MLIVDKMIQFVNNLKTYIILSIAKELKFKLQSRASIGDENKILKKEGTCDNFMGYKIFE